MRSCHELGPCAGGPRTAPPHTLRTVARPPAATAPAARAPASNAKPSNKVERLDAPGQRVGVDIDASTPLLEIKRQLHLKTGAGWGTRARP